MIRYITDNLTQRAFANISKIQFEGNDAYVEAVSKVFEMESIKDSITGWSIKFDESIWMPDDKTSCRNIIEIEFQIYHNDYSRVKFDLRKDINDYIR